MNYCPCCSNILLQHIRKTETYWFCRSCWQEMPVFTQSLFCSLPQNILSKTPMKIQQQKRVSQHTYLRERHSTNGWIGIKNLSNTNSM